MECVSVSQFVQGLATLKTNAPKAIDFSNMFTGTAPRHNKDTLEFFIYLSHGFVECGYYKEE